MKKEEALQKAIDFLKERIESLEKDVTHCLNKPYAPFPAILYCFSTLDLLGALYSGEGKKKTGISKRTADFMKVVMKYKERDMKLIQELFRHKIVHLAQPGPIVELDSEKYSWGYCHNDTNKHLFYENVNEKYFKYRFWVSIQELVNDIRKSIFGTDGYLSKINQKESLLKNFIKAYEEIYNLTRHLT